VAQATQNQGLGCLDGRGELLRRWSARHVHPGYRAPTLKMLVRRSGPAARCVGRAFSDSLAWNHGRRFHPGLRK